MTMRGRRNTPSFPRKEVPRRGGGWLPKWDEKEWGGSLRFVIPSAAEGSFSFPFSGAGMYNKKNLYMLFLCVP